MMQKYNMPSSPETTPIHIVVIFKIIQKTPTITHTTKAPFLPIVRAEHDSS